MHTYLHADRTFVRSVIMIGFFSISLLGATIAHGATTATLYPTSDGNYAQWTPKSGAVHYTQVDETTCNGTTDYVSETTVGQRDSYGISLSTIPDGSTITNIQITPCASRNSSGGGSATMNVFYRYNASNSADAGAYAVTGTTPVALSATNFASLALVKGSTSTLEIGSVYSAGTKGARLSRLATVITYTTPTPTVTTNTATVIGLSSATLNGSANPNGSGATGWYRYSTTNPGTCSDSFGTRAPVAGGDALGAGTSSVAYSEGVTSLTANTTYYVCAIASNGGGTGVGSVQSFTTLPNVPSAPSSASASNVSGTENSITWTDTSSDETGFKVERSTNDGAYVHIATTSVNATSYSDTGVTADNTYTYRVRAYNVTGNSGYSTTGYVITATVVPNTPNDFQNFVSTSTPPDVWLYITQTGTNEDGFTIERSTDNVNFGVIGTAPRAQFSNQFYSDIGPGTGTYYYRVYALNSIGNSGYSTTTIAVVP